MTPTERALGVFFAPQQYPLQSADAPWTPAPEREVGR